MQNTVMSNVDVNNIYILLVDTEPCLQFDNFTNLQANCKINCSIFFHHILVQFIDNLPQKIFYFEPAPLTDSEKHNYAEHGE